MKGVGIGYPLLYAPHVYPPCTYVYRSGNVCNFFKLALHFMPQKIGRVKDQGLNASPGL